jgi:hypothetical protein
MGWLLLHHRDENILQSEVVLQVVLRFSKTFEAVEKVLKEYYRGKNSHLLGKTDLGQGNLTFICLKSRQIRHCNAL